MTEDMQQEPQDGATPKANRVVTTDDFATVDLEAPIRESTKVDCRSLGFLYASAAAVPSEDARDEARLRVYRLLASVALMHFKPEDKAEPYGPEHVSGNQRGIIPSDLRGDQSNVFAEITADIRNPGLKARLSDIAWHNNRRLPAMARQAIDAYCDVVRAVLDGTAEFSHQSKTASSRDGSKMLRRASQIANATGRKDPQAARLRALIRDVILDAFGRNDHRGFLNVGELSLQFGAETPATIAANAETLTAANDPDPHTSRELWELAALAHRQSGNDQERDRCLVCAAECHVKLAEADDAQGIVASAHFMDAIEALRRIPGTHERRQQLESSLREAQASIRDEMGVVSTPVDLTTLVTETRRRVADLSLAQALAEFAQLSDSPDPDELRNDTLKLVEENPLFGLMPVSMVDEDGKVVAKSPGLAGDEEDSDLALHHLIARIESLRRQSDVDGMIEPARRLIHREHPLDHRDLRLLAEMSPLVPADRGALFALGFTRFFGGDFVSALHILVPQLEHSLRHVLKQAGVEPSAIHSDMTQENRTLSVILTKDRESLETFIDRAIVYEIENLFDFRGGPTIRHRLAHGLLSAHDCYGTDAIYACWFIFRLCCLPLFPHWEEVAERLDQL